MRRSRPGARGQSSSRRGPLAPAMTMRAGPLLATLLLLTAVLSLPAASARDPCGTPERAVRLSDVAVGVHTEGCVGASVDSYTFDCVQILWGVMTPVAGVGGHSGCQATAYVNPGAVLHLLA